MQKKILAAIICVVIVVGTSGAVAYQKLNSRKGNSYPITVQYYIVPNPTEFNISQYSLSPYIGWATDMSIDASLSCNHTSSLDCHNFYLTSNGQPLKMLYVDNSTVTIQGGIPLFKQLNFQVEGNQTNYRLAYQGNNVNIIQSSTPVA